MKRLITFQRKKPLAQAKLHLLESTEIVVPNS